MPTYQIRIPVQIRDDDVKRRPHDWRDDYVRVKIYAEDQKVAVQILQDRLGLTATIEIVSAPGDLCDNTKVLPDGSPCPGCRSCA
jgi:hypothetical protein